MCFSCFNWFSFVLLDIFSCITSQREPITTELAKLLVTSLILPRLDYCNSTLNSLPAYTIKMLTKLQYRAIRTIFRIKKYSRQHITPYMKSIHWLPIPYRIQYKLLLLPTMPPIIINLTILLNYLRTTSHPDHNEQYINTN